MANIPAILTNSDFSLPATWSGGVVPGPGDVAFVNGNTVFVSDSRTVQAVSNAVGSGIVAGGSFSLLNGCNLSATNTNGVVQGVTTASCIITSGLGVGASASLAASVTLTAATTTPAISFSGGGTLSTIGTIAHTAATVSGAVIAVTGSGTYNHTGNVTGGINGSGPGINVSSGAAVVSITGELTGGSFGTTAVALNISSPSAMVTVNGTVRGGTQASGVSNNAAATLTINGICQASFTMPAIAAGSASQNTRLSGPFLLGAGGNINPIQAQSWRWAPTLIPTYMEIAQSNGSTKRLLYSADNMPTGGYPVAANVRASIVYGPSNEFSGTLAVASPSSVALGVPTDNTVGTAVLTQANVQAALGTIGNLDAQLANKATVDQVAAIVQGATSA